MKRDIIADIESYIEYLIKAHSLYISIHPREYEAIIGETALVRFMTHTVPYCIYMKKYPEITRRCRECQDKVFKRCAEGEFSGVCHAGVFEFVYPFYSGQRLIGFVSVSGYKADGKKAAEAKKHITERYSVPQGAMEKYYATLSPERPEQSLVDPLLHPLCHMIELAYQSLHEKSGSDNKTDDIYTDILYFINRNRGSKISLEQMSRELGCSKSHISHTFKSRNGQSISSYLNGIRISEAKTLLLQSRLNVTEIALSVGFSDSNYFAIVFKRLVGMTPLEYRKNLNIDLKNKK